MTSISQLAQSVLQASAPEVKTARAHDMAMAWQSGAVDLPITLPDLDDRPARPKLPEMVSPSLVKRRRLGTAQGRGALLHAVAHIEFNAIDLAADMIARFAASEDIEYADRAAFISDWVSVCDDEARHFGLICARLSDLDMTYGDLPAHDGLWQAAEATKDSLIARLVIAPMVLEARGLDVTPSMIEKLRSANDPASADILQIIYDDEIGHVAAGNRWFRYLCKRQNAPLTASFHAIVRRYFNGLLKPPFNRAARDLAGMPVEFYEPLSRAEPC